MPTAVQVSKDDKEKQEWLATNYPPSEGVDRAFTCEATAEGLSGYCSRPIGHTGLHVAYYNNRISSGAFAYWVRGV